jgi:hypothetical protein
MPLTASAGESPGKHGAVAPALESLLHITGTFVSVIGLSLEHSAWHQPSTGTGYVSTQAGTYLTPASLANSNDLYTWSMMPSAVFVEGSSSVVIEDCHVRRAGGAGVTFGGGSANNADNGLRNLQAGHWLLTADRPDRKVEWDIIMFVRTGNHPPHAPRSFSLRFSRLSSPPANQAPACGSVLISFLLGLCCDLSIQLLRNVAKEASAVTVFQQIPAWFSPNPNCEHPTEPFKMAIRGLFEGYLRPIRGLFEYHLSTI